MQLLQWDKSYSINNDELDRHHVKLFGMFNMLHNICSGVDKLNNLSTVVDELIVYSAYHFTVEEQYMATLCYRDLGKHIAEHEYFRRKIIEIDDMAEENNTQQCHVAVVFLNNWLLNHVMEEDKKIIGNTGEA